MPVKRNITLAFILVVLILPLVSAKVPQLNIVNSQIYDIQYPQLEVLKQSRTMQLNFQVYNSSTGFLVTNNTVSCYFKLMNNTGHIIYLANATNFVHNSIFQVDIMGDNFSYSGDYAYKFECNSTNFGGYVSQGFPVTPSGRASLTEGESNALLAIILIIIFTSLFLTAIAFMFKGITGRLVFGSFGGICVIAAVMTGLVIFDKITWEINDLSGGYGAFWFGMKSLLQILLLGILIFVMYICFKSWRKKRGME